MLILALCHTVIPEKEDGKLVYRASSPDEEALVKAAMDVNVVFKARTPSHIIIDVVSTNSVVNPAIGYSSSGLVVVVVVVSSNLLIDNS